MSVATVKRPTGFVDDAKSSEATLRPSVALAPQSFALETEQLSRTVAERTLVSGVSVQVQPGRGLGGRRSKWGGQVVFPAAAEPARRANGRDRALQRSGLPRISSARITASRRYGHADRVS